MLLDSWQEILAALARNKLRALLTACGVFWGVFVLIVMLGLGRGLERGTKRNLGGMLTRSVFIWSQKTSMPYRGLQPGRIVRFRDQDIEALLQVPGVEDLAPRLRLGGWRDGVQVTYGETNGNFPVMGDYPAFQRVEPMDLTRGRFVNQRDLLEARKVAVIGAAARRVLMGESNPVGEYIRIRRAHFLIVGEVDTDKAGEEGDHVRSSVFVPFTTFQRAFNQPGAVGWFALTASDGVEPERLEQMARTALISRHRIHPDDALAVGSFNAAEKFNQIQSLFRGIERFVWFVGTLTLFAGVLGVSNILLITVKERTREFGIRKALGATPRAIVLMVVKEAVALTAIAGYLGIVLGVAVIAGLEHALNSLQGAPLAKPEVDFHAAVLAAVVLMLSGVGAGVVPARHAARISPVEALRSE